MARNELARIALPDGEAVEVSSRPLKWWGEHNASGHVSPKLLAPDPKNPRRRITKQRVDELNKSIRAIGVRQSLIVTPRHKAPWAKIKPEHEGCYFLVVSGHTRREGALSAEIGAVPIMVRIYKDEKAHRLDASLANRGQEKLDPLDEALELERLQKLGCTLEELSDDFGISKSLVMLRVNLTKLSPEMQKQLDPEIPRDRRLQTTVGGYLGGVRTPLPEELKQLCSDLAAHIPKKEKLDVRKIPNLKGDALRFELQRILYAVIKRRRLRSVQAMEFIRDRGLQLKAASAAVERSERMQPQRRQNMVDTFLSGISGSPVMDWKPEEFRRIYETTTPDEIDGVAASFTEAGELLAGLGTQLKKMASDRRKTPVREVVRLDDHRKRA